MFCLLLFEKLILCFDILSLFFVSDAKMRGFNEREVRYENRKMFMLPRQSALSNMLLFALTFWILSQASRITATVASCKCRPYPYSSSRIRLCIASSGSTDLYDLSPV